jgi:hypothetical protein
MKSESSSENENLSDDEAENSLPKNSVDSAIVSDVAQSVEHGDSKMRRKRDVRSEIETILDFFEHSYSLKGKAVKIGDRAKSNIEKQKPLNSKEESEISALLEICISDDEGLQVPPQILISLMESNLTHVLKTRISRYLSNALQFHPMLSAEIYRNTLASATPDFQELFKQLHRSIERFQKQKSFTPSELMRLRRNAITTFLLIFALRQKWETEEFISKFNQHFWSSFGQVDLKASTSNIARLSKSNEDSGSAVVAKVMFKRIDSLNAMLLKANQQIDINHERALNAEHEVEQRANVNADLQRKILLLAEDVSALTMEIAERDKAIENAATHHVDDYDTFRTRILRMLMKQVELLVDGLHALRNNNHEVADEFMDRTILSLNREIEKLKDEKAGE